MSEYKNLPGVNINIKDGEMLLTQDNTVNSMLIIGEVKAPYHIEVEEDVVFVQSEDVLFEKFGRYFYQGEVNPIAAEWHIARSAGIQNIFLLGLKKGTLKDNFIKLQDLLENVIADYQFSHVLVTNMYADEEIRGLTAEDFGVSDLGEVIGVDSYHLTKGTTELEDLDNREGAPITLDVVYNGIDFSVTIKNQYYTPKELVRHLSAELKSAAMNVGFDKLDIEVVIEDKKAIIRSNEEIEVKGQALSALGIDAEDLNLEFEGVGNAANLLGKYAERQTIESEAMIVYIGTKPPATTRKSDIREMVDRLVERKNEHSKNVQVVAGPEVAVSLPNSNRTYWSSGVSQYATLVDSLAVQHAPTNQPLPGASALRYDLSLRQLDDLVGNRYVTFRRKNNRIVVVDGVTTAPDYFSDGDRGFVRSDFSRLSTLRSTNYMVGAIREAVEPFIGRPNEFPVYNAMNTAIKAAINRAVELGIIQDAIYSIELGDSMDASTVNLTILPQFELRQIDVSIGLSTPSGFEALSN